MDAVVAVWRLGVGSVELVRRPWHVAVRGPLVRLARPPPTQGRIRMVERTPHRREALVSGVVERTVGPCPPEPMLFGDQLLYPIQDRLLVHGPSILARRRHR